MLLGEKELYLTMFSAACFGESVCPCLCTLVVVNLTKAGASRQCLLAQLT